MSAGRLPASVLVSALIRRVQDAGGHAVLLARGDPHGGAILVLAGERGANWRFVERGLGATGEIALIASGPADPDSATATAYWQRRRASDPDLWVVEVDIASPERFAAEMILPG